MSEKVKSIRKALKLSQRAFGEALGVSRAVINNIECGRVQPRPQFLQLICHIYQVNAHWLETGEGDMFGDVAHLTDQSDQVLGLFKALRPELQDCAIAQLKALVKLQGEL